MEISFSTPKFNIQYAVVSLPLCLTKAILNLIIENASQTLNMSPLRKVKKRKNASKTLRLEVSQSVIDEKINFRADFEPLWQKPYFRGGLKYYS